MLTIHQEGSVVAGLVAIMAVPMGHVAAQSDTLQPISVPWEVATPAFFAMSVADLDASTEWYRRVLGLVPVRDVASRDGRSQARVLRRSNLVVELIAFGGSVDVADVLGPRAHRFMVQGPVKVGLWVLDAGAVRDWLARYAVDTDARVGLDETLDARTFVFRDLDGNRIQVFEDCDGRCGDR